MNCCDVVACMTTATRFIATRESVRVCLCAKHYALMGKKPLKLAGPHPLGAILERI